jgi:hypothetical protein
MIVEGAFEGTEWRLSLGGYEWMESRLEGVVPYWCWCRPVGCFVEGLQPGHGQC